MLNIFICLVVPFAQITDTDSVQPIIKIIKQRVDFVSLDVTYDLVENNFRHNTSEIKKCHYAFQGDDFYYSVDWDVTQNHQDSEEDKKRKDLLRMFGKPPFETNHMRMEYALFKGARTSKIHQFAPGFSESSSAGFENGGTDFFTHGRLPTPRTVLGELGPGARDQSARTNGILLPAFLDSPGPFYFYEEGGYRVLCHKCSYNDGEKQRDVSAALWLDKDDNLVRIEQGMRPWGISPELIKKYHDGPWHTAFKIGSRLECWDFVDDGKGHRFPMNATKSFFLLEPGEYERIENQIKQQKLSADEAQILKCLGNVSSDPTLRFEITLDPTKAKLSLPIDEKMFQLTFDWNSRVITDEKGSTRIAEREPLHPWYKDTKVWALLIVFSCIVLGTAFITRRLLGWKW